MLESVALCAIDMMSRDYLPLYPLYERRPA